MHLSLYAQPPPLRAPLSPINATAPVPAAKRRLFFNVFATMVHPNPLAPRNTSPGELSVRFHWLPYLTRLRKLRQRI
jgi:hypothetical protein